MASNRERPLFRSAVFVMAENGWGEYLLQRRSGTGFLDGYFDVSGSGHLEYGESLEACGVRELKEETGLVAREEDLELMSVFQSDFEANIKYLNVVYKIAKFTGSLINGEPTKIDQLGWFALKGFPDKLTVGVRIFLEALRDGGVKNYYIGPDEYTRLMGGPFTSD